MLTLALPVAIAIGAVASILLTAGEWRARSTVAAYVLVLVACFTEGLIFGLAQTTVSLRSLVLDALHGLIWGAVAGGTLVFLTRLACDAPDDGARLVRHLIAHRTIARRRIRGRAATRAADKAAATTKGGY